ncbi:MAG: PEP-CTERM sorting domain-containing protein, partial [Acidobacteriota bacterium]|nr:PEP-CTERM sorting domain-containing protein [Acidobacteriota bacterium]
VTIAEGASGDAFYTPAAGQPGYDSSAPTYRFISDVTSTVPEPASIALLIFGGGALLIGNSLRRRTRQPV